MKDELNPANMVEAVSVDAEQSGADRPVNLQNANRGGMSMPRPTEGRVVNRPLMEPHRAAGKSIPADSACCCAGVARCERCHDSGSGSRELALALQVTAVNLNLRSSSMRGREQVVHHRGPIPAPHARAVCAKAPACRWPRSPAC